MPTATKATKSTKARGPVFRSLSPVASPPPIMPASAFPGAHAEAERLHQRAKEAFHRNRFEECERLQRRALALSPDCCNSLQSLGTTLINQGRFAEAVAPLRRANALNPTGPNTFNALVWSLIYSDPAAAVAFLDAPTAPRGLTSWDADMLYLYACLMNGNYQRYRDLRRALFCKQRASGEGMSVKMWDGISLPLPAGPDAPLPIATLPHWNGEDDLTGKTIVCLDHSGIGDTLQFVRFVPLLKTLFGAQRVILAVRPCLLSLLQDTPDVDEVVLHEGREILMAADGSPVSCWTWTTFLPEVFVPLVGGIERVGDSVPYITPAPVLLDAWRARVEAVSRPGDLRVGVVWASGPKTGAAAFLNARALTARDFAPFADVPGVSLISLQKGPSEATYTDIPGCKSLSAEIGDFADTAAIIRGGLDLVISVDTSVAHLAGALGVPVLVTLKHMHCFRWMLGRDDSPWYPSMRLFRQQRVGPQAWAAVIERVAAALRQLVTERGTSYV